MLLGEKAVCRSLCILMAQWPKQRRNTLQRNPMAGHDLSNALVARRKAEMDGLIALRAKVADLMMEQDRLYQGWIKFMIAAQAGLATGFSFAVAGDAKPEALIYIIPLIAVVCTWSFQIIIARQQRWAIWFLRKCDKLTSVRDKIFPTEHGELDNLPVGTMSKIVRRLALTVIVAWIAAAIWVWWQAHQLEWLLRAWLS
jgi:hypothetical protein